MDLSIIIVNWNTSTLLNNCISSIKEETKNIDYEIIINDNNSSDNSCKIVEENHPDVILIKSNVN
ncbi:MAG TPA: hypothetical protein DD426_11170, partial [Clostridiaceae bacterium]|nr:hypothetical protein [Clostridiaceae bacterium]